MRLDTFIKDYGLPELATKLKVSERTIENWRDYRHVPSPRFIYKIDKIAKKRLSYRDTIDRHIKFLKDRGLFTA